MMDFHWYSQNELVNASAPGHVHPMTVRVQDVDAAGTMFFAHVFEYCHDAYMAFLLDRDGVLNEEGRIWGQPLLRVEAHFLKPLRFTDRFDVHMALAWVDGSCVTVGFRLLHAGRVAAVAQLARVFIDLKTGKKMDVPARAAAALRSIGGGA